MSQTGNAFREHHRQLIDTLAAQAFELVAKPADTDPQTLVSFLKQELLPHAAGEEEYLYPVVDSLIKAYGTSTATMSLEHRFIEESICEIEKLSHELASANEQDHIGLHIRLSRLVLQLEAVLRLHIEKEEKIYLPLVEQYLSEDQQQEILENMHSPSHYEAPSLDVRPLVPAQRHHKIFETFEALKPREAFVLINDHDPKPLYYQFQAERSGEFTWDYLESGPEVWRVKIGKRNNDKS